MLYTCQRDLVLHARNGLIERVQHLPLRRFVMVIKDDHASFGALEPPDGSATSAWKLAPQFTNQTFCRCRQKAPTGASASRCGDCRDRTVAIIAFVRRRIAAFGPAAINYVACRTHDFDVRVVWLIDERVKWHMRFLRRRRLWQRVNAV